jgi:probable aminopeptidase NPEPL1
MPHTLEFTADPSTLFTGDAAITLQVIGRRKALTRDAIRDIVPPGAHLVWADMLRGDAGDQGRTATTYLAQPPIKRVTACVLPEPCSRHNSPARTFVWPRLLASGRGSKNVVVAVLDDAAHAVSAVCAIARSIPSYSARSKQSEGTTTALLLGPDGPIATDGFDAIAEGVRFAAELVDSPPDVLGPDAFVQRAAALGETAGVSVHVLRREGLVKQGLGGLAGVGRAAEQEPALVVLDWSPQGAETRMCWVGKGVTYDTGGLSLKTKNGMPGMKSDMGGAAAVLAAFRAAVKRKVDLRLTAILCIAENAIGPRAIRPDDILHMYSGKTVEVNNTDAEGRLCLADGVAWAVKHRDPEILVDMATLTGAQGVATGKAHGALYCNDDALERRAVLAGRASGDLVHPLPYAPELYRKEFASTVADMKNSVKDRSNAQSSCAGQFIGNHLGDYDGLWLHIDMAAPSRSGQRATGYGVGLLLTLAGVGAPLDDA